MSEALEYLLVELERAHPELSEADQETRDTARWAQQQLDRLLRRAAARPLTFSLVAELDGSLIWSKDAIVPDVPGARSIAGLPIVFGRCANLQHVFGLRTARESLRITVESTRRVRSAPYLDPNIKSALLAFLDARGADRDQVATRLARLRDSPAELVTLKVSYDRRRISVDRPAYVETLRDRRGAIRGGTLHWSPAKEINTLSLAEELAFYLGDPEQAEPLALLLSNPSDVLDRYQITNQDLDLAHSILLAAARRAKLTDESEEVEAEDEPATQAEEPKEAAEQEPADTAAQTEPATSAPTRNGGDGTTGTSAPQIRQALQSFGRGLAATPLGESRERDAYASPWTGVPLSFGSPAETQSARRRTPNPLPIVRCDRRMETRRKRRCLH